MPGGEGEAAEPEDQLNTGACAEAGWGVADDLSGPGAPEPAAALQAVPARRSAAGAAAQAADGGPKARKDRPAGKRKAGAQPNPPRATSAPGTPAARTAAVLRPLGPALSTSAHMPGTTTQTSCPR